MHETFDNLVQGLGEFATLFHKIHLNFAGADAPTPGKICTILLVRVAHGWGPYPCLRRDDKKRREGKKETTLNKTAQMGGVIVLAD